MTQRWRTLVLLYPVLDARYGSGLGRKRAQRVMGREERGVIERIIEGLPAIVTDWSDGLAALDPVDVIEVRRKVKSLSASGGGKWWVGPRECREELLEWASDDRYDHVYALWPCEPDVPQCGWGCTTAPSEATFGAGFSSISTDHWRTLATDPIRHRAMSTSGCMPWSGATANSGSRNATCRPSTMRASSRRPDRSRSRRSGGRSPNTTMAAAAWTGRPGPGRRGTATT